MIIILMAILLMFILIFTMAEIQSTLLLKSIMKGCYANYLPIPVKEPFQVRENTRRTILLILKVIPRNSNELISDDSDH
jgi:hypothetical protein